MSVTATITDSEADRICLLRLKLKRDEIAGKIKLIEIEIKCNRRMVEMCDEFLKQPPDNNSI